MALRQRFLRIRVAGLSSDKLSPMNARTPGRGLTIGTVVLAMAASGVAWSDRRVADAAAGAAPVARIDAFRERLLAVMGWPGRLRVRLMDGEVRREGVTYVFGVRGEKRLDGALDLVVEVGEAGAATQPGLTVHAQVSAPRRTPGTPLDVAVDGRADPTALARVWPAALPAPSALTTRSTLVLSPGGHVQAAGRLTIGSPGTPALVDFTSRYEAQSGRLSVTRYAVDWKPGVAIAGTASLDADGRLAATAAGTVDAGRLDGRLSYAPTGAVQGDLNLTSLDLAALATRLGMAPFAARASALTARVSGAAGRPVALEARARGVTLGAMPAVGFDATLDATSSMPRGVGAATSLPRLDAATLSLAREGQTLAVVKGTSRGAALWPLAVDATVAELARLAPLVPWPASIEGAARVTGELSRGDALRFAGTVEAEMPRAEVTAGGRITLAGTRARIPLVWTSDRATPGAAELEPGSLFVDRVVAFGFELDRVIGSARATDGRLRLPDLAWTHYGGHGGASVELALDGDPVLVRGSATGARVDLAQVMRAFGSDVARVTGRVRYQITTLYARAEGLVVRGQVTSEDDGGEIGIDVLEQLLEARAVQDEASGILRQTLQNLRRFDYESLAGEFRWSNGAGFIDLTLRGKKRLGIFPGPVEAINIKNMPLSVLTRALTRRS